MLFFALSRGLPSCARRPALLPRSFSSAAPRPGVVAVQFQPNNKTAPVKHFGANADGGWLPLSPLPPTASTSTTPTTAIDTGVLDSSIKPWSQFPHSNWRFWMHHFLPEEYPQSVSQGYLAYQGWLFLQWVLQSFTYMFSTYALLSSVGVANAMPLSAAMNWVLKDGLGCVGMMLAASRLGGRVDESPKRTKLLADACFHVGVAMEMLLLLPSEHDPLLWIVVASVANALKAMSGLIGGACRASLNSTFALQQNLGDITAKSQSQSTMGYLIGMLGGIPLSRVTGEDSGRIILAVAAFSAGALYCSTKALSAVPLRSLNGHRAALLFRAHISSKQMLSIEQVRAQERFFTSPALFNGHLQGASLVFGAALQSAFASPRRFQSAVHIFARERYLLSIQQKDAAADQQSVAVVLHPDATPYDVLQAFYHCQLIDAKGVSLPMEESLQHVRTDFPALWDGLLALEWSLERVHIRTGDIRVSWT